MSSVKPVYNIVTGYVKCRDLMTGEIYYAAKENLKYDNLHTKEDPFVELAVTGPLTWHTRKEKRYVEITNEDVDPIIVTNLEKFGGNL